MNLLLQVSALLGCLLQCQLHIPADLLNLIRLTVFLVIQLLYQSLRVNLKLPSIEQLGLLILKSLLSRLELLTGSIPAVLQLFNFGFEPLF